MAAPPPPTPVPPIVGLLVRILTFVCLIISTVILATNKITISVTSSDLNGDYASISEESAKFNLFYAYRYLLSCTVIGMVYALLQTALAVAHVSTGKRVADFLDKFDFYVDLIVCNLLVSGAAASFGLTVDLKRLGLESTNNFFDKIYAAASLCLIGFVFNAISTVFSHLNATRRSSSSS